MHISFVFDCFNSSLYPKFLTTGLLLQKDDKIEGVFFPQAAGPYKMFKDDVALI